VLFLFLRLGMGRAHQALDAMRQAFDPMACALVVLNTRRADTPPRDWCPPELFADTLPGNQPPARPPGNMVRAWRRQRCRPAY
jgi:hypothetical protein